jgi:hypothetical protein
MFLKRLTFGEKHDITSKKFVEHDSQRRAERLENREESCDTCRSLMVDLGLFTTQTADRVDDSGTFRSSVTEVQYVVLNLLDVDWQIAMCIRNADVCQLGESTRDRTEPFGCAGSAYQTGRIGSITKSPSRSL